MVADGHHMITIAHIEPMAQVGLKKFDWDLKHKLKQTCHLPSVLPTKIDSDVIF